MAGNMNMAIISGRLGKDPEIRNNGQGKPIVSFSVASGEYWMKDGEKKEKTEWFNVTCFNEVTCRYLEHHVKKGDYVNVTGRIRTRKWQAQDGSDRWSTEIVIEAFFGAVEKVATSTGGNRPPPADSPDEYGRQSSRPSANRPSSNAPAFEPGGMDDDIPF